MKGPGTATPDVWAEFTVEHIAHGSQLIGLLFQTGHRASPEPLPGVVWRTSYRYLLQSLHQTEVCWDPTAEVALQRMF